MFKLVRYFSITSLIAFIIIIALLGMFYRRMAINDLVALRESGNVALTQAFSNSLWPRFAPFVTSVSGLSGDELRVHPEIARLRQAVLAQMVGLSVIKVKVYNLEGLTVFSTEAGQIGEDKSANAGYLSARSGQVASELTHRDTFNAFEEIIEDRDVLSSYVPIRRGGPTGPIEGVFELYSDATPLMQRIERVQRYVVIGVTLILALLYAVLFFIVRHADGIIQHQHIERKRVGEALQKAKDELEIKVDARNNHLEVLASLSERLSAILDLETLLPEVTNQVQDSFGYYHAHIYLLDDKQEKLVVAAGTGPAGAEMKAKGHSIWLNAPTSLVARAARNGQIVRVDNVREAEDWLPNPLLPETYSEMAVPIILEGEVVGVLDVQQDRIAGLDEGDADLLRSLANQVAVAIRNARLFEEAETALAKAREVQRLYVEQSWDKDRVVRQGSGRVQFSLGESTTLSEAALAKARNQALAQDEPAVVMINNSEAAGQSVGESATDLDKPSHYALVAPITLGDVTIGNLQLHEVDPHRKWTESDLAFINAIIDQVAQTAENLRLLNQTQERASREQLISQVSDKLRRAPDLETLMKVATVEISRVLNPGRTFVRFDTETVMKTSQNGEIGEDSATAEPEENPQIEEDFVADEDVLPTPEKLGDDQ